MSTRNGNFELCNQTDANKYPYPIRAPQKQYFSGLSNRMGTGRDHVEASYTDSSRLAGSKALITGGDSGIGSAVRIAFAREGSTRTGALARSKYDL